jgi:hypothetical protein
MVDNDRTSAEEQIFGDFDDFEAVEEEEEYDSSAPTYGHAERILQLIHLLGSNTCTFKAIFERMEDYYSIDGIADSDRRKATRAPYWTLRRDMRFLKNIGYQIQQSQDANKVKEYTLVKGSGPVHPILFKQTELDILALLYTLFVSPTQVSTIDTKQPLSSHIFRHPLAQDTLLLIERLIAMFPPEQKAYFEKQMRTPILYFNLDTVTNYLPHRATIDTIAHALSSHQQLRFGYISSSFSQSTTTHQQVDPHYIVQLDEHLYLVGYSHAPDNPRKNRIFEWRIDRIKAESIQVQPNRMSLITGGQPRRPITFRYWADASIAKGGLSQRWLSQTVEQEEIVGEGRQRRHRLLVQAQAYDGWRIIQQLHKYADKVELIDPPELRELMRQEVKRMYDIYFQSGQNQP